MSPPYFCFLSEGQSASLSAASAPAGGASKRLDLFHRQSIVLDVLERGTALWRFHSAGRKPLPLVRSGISCLGRIFIILYIVSCDTGL